MWIFNGCSSSISQAIDAGDTECGIACGVEDMFGVPMGGLGPSFHPDLYEKDYYMGMGKQQRTWLMN